MNTINQNYIRLNRTIKLFLCLLVLGLLATTEVSAQNFWQQTNGPYGGDVRSFAINSSGHIFAGTAGGGVFRTTAKLPSVVHTPQFSQQAGQKITIAAKITGDVAIDGAILYYRRGADSTFMTKSMSADADSFRVTIPANSVTSRGVEYFIVATDVDGFK